MPCLAGHMFFSQDTAFAGSLKCLEPLDYVRNIAQTKNRETSRNNYFRVERRQKSWCRNQEHRLCTNDTYCSTDFKRQAEVINFGKTDWYKAFRLIVILMHVHDHLNLGQN